MRTMHDMAGAYAIDALDQFDATRYELHLAECEDCRHAVDRLRGSACALAASVASEPPAALRDVVLAIADRMPSAEAAADLVGGPDEPAPTPPAQRRGWFRRR